MPEDKTSQYITITVEEYAYLTKAATLLETIMNTEGRYAPVEMVDAIRTTMGKNRGCVI